MYARLQAIVGDAVRLEAEDVDCIGALTSVLDGTDPIDVKQAASLMDHWAT